MLGICDPKVLADCKRFREARNDLMHEKAVELGALAVAETRFAQAEAAFAVAFIGRIQSLLATAA